MDKLSKEKKGIKKKEKKKRPCVFSSPLGKATSFASPTKNNFKWDTGK